MEANRFYSVPFDGHHWTDVCMLARILGRDRFEVYGRWHAFLGVLYQAGGRIVLNEMWRSYLCCELGLDEDGLDEWLEACAQVDLIDSESLHVRDTAASNGVCAELMRRAENRANGKKGGRPKKNETKGDA